MWHRRKYSTVIRSRSQRLLGCEGELGEARILVPLAQPLLSICPFNPFTGMSMYNQTQRYATPLAVISARRFSRCYGHLSRKARSAYFQCSFRSVFFLLFPYKCHVGVAIASGLLCPEETLPRCNTLLLWQKQARRFWAKVMGLYWTTRRTLYEAGVYILILCIRSPHLLIERALSSRCEVSYLHGAKSTWHGYSSPSGSERRQRTCPREMTRDYA